MGIMDMIGLGKKRDEFKINTEGINGFGSKDYSMEATGQQMGMDSGHEFSAATIQPDEGLFNNAKDPFGSELDNSPRAMPGMSSASGPRYGGPRPQNASAFSASMTPPNINSPYAPPQQYTTGRNGEMEVISAKLDAIKATLDAMNQRIASLERVAYGETDTRRKNQW